MIGSDASRWTVDRRTFIGGSEIAAVCGLHPTRTALDVWGNKVAGYEVVVGPEAEVGLAYEAPTVELYRSRLAIADELQMHGTLVDPAHPWAGATPDRIRITGDSCINVQVKVVGEHMTHRWGRPELSPESVPLEVLAQVMWEARAIEAGLGIHVDLIHVVANIGGTDIRVYPVPFDRELVGLLFDRAREWWTTYVVPRVMPEITEENASAARALLAHLHPRETLPSVPCTSAEASLALAYDSVRAEAKSADGRLELARSKLVAAIGDRIGFESDDGMIRVTHKANSRGARSLLVTVREI